MPASNNQPSGEKLQDKKKIEFQLTNQDFFQAFTYDEKKPVRQISHGVLVHGVHATSGKKVAVKILRNLNQNQVKVIKREIELLILLHSHNRVISLEGYTIASEENKLTRAK